MFSFWANRRRFADFVRRQLADRSSRGHVPVRTIDPVASALGGGNGKAAAKNSVTPDQRQITNKLGRSPRPAKSVKAPVVKAGTKVEKKDLGSRKK